MCLQAGTRDPHDQSEGKLAARLGHFLPQTFFFVFVVVKGESVYDEKVVDINIRLTVMGSHLAYWLCFFGRRSIALKMST